jgi:hypothetical protein
MGSFLPDMSYHRLLIAELTDAARDEVLAIGQVKGNYVLLTPEQYVELRTKHHPNERDATTAALDMANGIPPCRGCGG